jgi:calcineurin-like phosphoesterase family protein
MFHISKPEDFYLASDFHLGHKNILKYDKERKFSSLEEHDQYIISEINSLPEDSYLIFL